MPSIAAAWKVIAASEAKGQKLLVGSLLTALPLFNLILPIGYCMVVMEQHIRGQSPRLPSWRSWTHYGTRGLQAFALLLLHLLPLVVLASLVFQGILAWARNGLEALWLSFGALVLFTGWLLLLSLYANVALTRFAEQNRFAAAWEVTAVWANLAPRFGQWLTTTLGAGAFFIAVNYLCLQVADNLAWSLLLASPLNFCGLLIACHLFAQVYSENRQHTLETIL